jgi:hypothetical protein
MNSEGNAQLSRLDTRAMLPKTGQVLAFSCVRNELPRLPAFLGYHRELGVKGFYFVDNASTDGTREWLLAQPDVYVYWTDASYGASRCGVDWLNELLHRHGVGHWTLTLDADEFLAYPGSDTGVRLGALTHHMDKEGVGALETFMLDMYSDKPIREVELRTGVMPWTQCGYFDADTYHQRSKEGIPQRGGPRHRLFWTGRARPKPSPVLQKFPLVRWSRELRYEASTHVIAAPSSPSVSGVLLHFKFFSDLYRLAAAEVERREHWDAAAQYESYLSVLRENPSLSAYFAGSMAYSGTRQLVDLGLIRDAAGFARCAQAAETDQ